MATKKKKTPRRYELDDEQKMSLAERLAERHQRGDSELRGRASRAAFVAQLDDIKEALDLGWPIKAVWEQLQVEGKCEVGYSAFRSLCKEFGLARRTGLAMPERVERKPSSEPRRGSPSGTRPVFLGNDDDSDDVV